jgi:hypothetical protein
MGIMDDIRRLTNEVENLRAELKAKEYAAVETEVEAKVARYAAALPHAGADTPMRRLYEYALRDGRVFSYGAGETTLEAQLDRFFGLCAKQFPRIFKTTGWAGSTSERH